MRIHLTGSGNVALREPGDFRRLDVLYDPQPETVLERSIARVGRREGTDHVRVAPAVLRFLSGHAGEADWEAGFSRMLEFAEGAGWVDLRGDVRAHLVRNAPALPVPVEQFKAAMRALPAAISVVTTGSGEAVCGLVVSSLTSVSADPPLVGFFINESASCRAMLLRTGRFVANVIGDTHGPVMDAFLTRPQGPERFEVGHWRESQSGVPVLADALASIECEIAFTQRIGTHLMVIGSVARVACSKTNPVVYFEAGTHALHGREGH